MPIPTDIDNGGGTSRRPRPMCRPMPEVADELMRLVESHGTTLAFSRVRGDYDDVMTLLRKVHDQGLEDATREGRDFDPREAFGWILDEIAERLGDRHQADQAVLSLECRCDELMETLTRE